MKTLRDILVVGGGPVGLYAALEARRAGLDVLVLEARSGVIDKACGEGLMPAAVAALQRAGVNIARRRTFTGIRYIEGGREASGHFRSGPGWGVRRTDLHRALRERVDALGIPVLRRVVRDIRQHDGEVEVDGLHARHVLAADGLRSGVRRRLGLELPARHRTKRYGLVQHLRVAPWSDLVEVHWHELGEAYVTPVADDEVGIAFLFDERTVACGEHSFDELLARFPDLASRVRQAPRCSKPRGAGPFEQRSARAAEGRVLLVGDAAGYLDPVTGEGLRLGFLAATAAVDCIRNDRVGDYDRQWRELVRSYWWGTTALLALRRSPLRRLMMPALVAVPALFDAILGRLGEGAPAAMPDAADAAVPASRAH